MPRGAQATRGGDETGSRTPRDGGVTGRNSVIVELRVAAEGFELGRILNSARDLDIELETMVPLGRQPVPFFVVHDEVSGAFESRIGGHPSVESIDAVGARLDTARTTGDVWALEVRFPSHGALARFEERFTDADIGLTATRIYNPTKPEGGPWFGLTGPQREALVRAVEGGYYAIPRRMSTNDLAGEFGISDQAVTERLRRAVVTLVRNTVLVTDPEE